jgi:REP element-mobilizing transposase RayT
MPRQVRIEIEGGLYHVYNRAGQGQRPFAKDDEADRFLDLFREIKRRDGLVVFAWCLLPNHYHLAVRTRSVPLWRSMRSLQHRFALGFNRRRGVKGPVWQSRYKAKLIEDQGYFDQLLAYIHLNPVTAGIVEDPAEYRWSGHRELIRKVEDPIVDVDDALMAFGSSLRSARAAYVRSLRGNRETEWVGETLSRLPWWLDRDEREIQPVDSGPHVDIHGRSTGLDRPVLSAAEYLEAVEDELGVELGEIAGRGRKPAIVQVRDLVAVLGVERYGVSVKGLSEVTGRQRVTVSKWVARGAEKRSSDSAFERRVDDLDRRIAKRKP